MIDFRVSTKEELANYVVENKANSHMLAEGTDAEVRKWAEGKDRQFLIEICAGWSKDVLISWGVRSR